MDTHIIQEEEKRQKEADAAKKAKTTSLCQWGKNCRNKNCR
jgi:hypothetical protein